MPARLRIAAALAATALAGGAVRAEVIVQAELIALSASVLKVEVQRRQGGYSLGSGVVVADERVLTNCHVTRDATAVAVLKNGLRYAAQAQALDAAHDLCLLRVDGVRGGVLPLGRSQALRDGEPVVALGYTLGIGLASADGRVVGLYPLDGGAVVQSTNGFSSGASGGALLDAQRRLVGILTFRLRGGEAHYFSAPAEWARPLLDGQVPMQPVAPDDGGARYFWAVPEAQQPAFLRAQSLLRGHRWAELRTLAQRWARDALSDPQPPFLLGQAEEALGRWRDAMGAFEDAVRRDQGFAPGWLRLGLASVALGLNDRAREALRRLEDLQSDLAGPLAARLANP